jgi:hypothetical protein
MEMTCCEDYEINIKIINGFIVMDHVHGGSGYKGKLFVYCPWCGTKLKTEE